MFLGANWLLRRLRGKCREKGNAAALRLFISQRFLKTPVLSLAAPPHTPLTVIHSPAHSPPAHLDALLLWFSGLAQATPYLLVSQTAKWGPYTLQTHFCSRGKSEHKCPPKCVWMLATSLCRSLQRGTSYSPKAIGLYNLLCTRLWLWKKEGFFFFFFESCWQDCWSVSSHGQNKHLVGEKIIGVFFVSVTGFPSPAIWFF